MQDPAFWTQLALTVFGPAGAAAVAVRVVLNGTKERVKDIKTVVDETRHEVKESRSELKETKESVQYLREIWHNHEARLWRIEEGVETK